MDRFSLKTKPDSICVSRKERIISASNHATTLEERIRQKVDVCGANPFWESELLQHCRMNIAPLGTAIKKFQSPIDPVAWGPMISSHEFCGSNPPFCRQKWANIDLSAAAASVFSVRRRRSSESRIFWLPRRRRRRFFPSAAAAPTAEKEETEKTERI